MFPAILFFKQVSEFLYGLFFGARHQVGVDIVGDSDAAMSEALRYVPRELPARSIRLA